ncbi:amidase [Solirubrobacter sp. CPCC 204708]|uniref:Amidase family protein n=1 Tax=Solirubrobacter deserti TaxID=2282478 RepID=A0ABT4RFD3_9ACTN|nr:amidase family protein [Solirubrobacter deserti]MBE2319473.1 amidase [Solirubrobacter deserti]MDA0137240.1 amidase family protein [Solirubrobacter deserti]
MDDADLAFAGATRHAELIAAGELTSRQLTELFLDRIARLDPLLNAYRVVFREQALAQADAADAGGEGPLNGVPIAIKDDLHVAGEVTAYGCDADPQPQPVHSEVVARLRAAGAVILGKTHVPELMATPFTESPTFGVTRNPWDPHRTSGGSSGGSATAVAAGLASAALGSDGAGSIRIPAACTHLFGLKPQRGRVPSAPDTDAHQGMAVFGPLTRTVADAGRIMDVIADGGPSLAEAAAAEPGRLRVAISTGLPPIGVSPDAEQLEAVAYAAAVLRELGHDVHEREFDWGLTMGNRILTRFVRGIGDMAVEIGHRDRLSRRARGLARLGVAIPPQAARAAAAQAAADAERMNRIFDHADVVLTPMFTRRPPRVREYDGRGGARTLLSMTRLAPYNAAFNHTGQPAVSVPAGFTRDRFPRAVQLVAPPDGEARLVSLAAQIEKVTEWPAERPMVAA